MKDASSLKPHNFDISELKVILDNIEDMIYPNVSKKNRPLISYSVEEGCVRNIFRTNLQGVATFFAIASLVATNGTLEGLNKSTAKSFANLQNQAIKKDYSLTFKDSQKAILTIDKTTNYFITPEVLVDSEFYFYGTLNRAGGSSKPSIVLKTEDYGNLTIYTSKSKLANIEENVLYEDCAVRAIGKINPFTGEIDKSHFKLLEIIDYSAKYDEYYLDSLIKKSSGAWSGIDIDKWVRELRGGLVYE